MSPANDMNQARGGRLAIIGNGMAATRLVDRLRELGGLAPDRWQVTVLGAEPRSAYNRILLSDVVSGRVDPSATDLVDDRAWRSEGIDLRLATRVTAVDAVNNRITTAAGDRIAFDACVFATGSRPFIPPLSGLPDNVADADVILPRGVLSFRTMDDALAIVGWAARAASVVGQQRPRAVVLGGGLLGLEAAKGLTGRGINTTVIHMAGHLMERQLDRQAGAILQRSFAKHGIEVQTGAAAKGLELENGTVRAVVLAGGRVVPADLVVISAGVRPNVDLAGAAGLCVARGIQVDDELRVLDHDNIFAIGECAEHRGQVYGLVAPAWEQAEQVAEVLTGRPREPYRGSRMITRLKAAGIGVASMGDVMVDAEQDDPDTEVITVSDPARETYKKLVVRDGRLAGAILLGDIAASPALAQAYDRQSRLPPDRLALLLGRDTEPAHDPTRIPDSATICRCNGVTKGDIRKAFLAGADNLTDVVTTTRATTGCGGCLDPVTGIVKWLQSAEQGSYRDPGFPAGASARPATAEAPQTTTATKDTEATQTTPRPVPTGSGQ